MRGHRANPSNDIGYSPELVATGFHPLDGARYLRAAHVDEHRLVAHHSAPSARRVNAASKPP
ncbi:hypothetical protein LI90_612 [Carbonactinospora thermoautotrophica]|uniref:Uncharacterized protein n=1 Tax=Carbonactinospora thermoautotrophica TaxID=1469144 RepID=A0A132MM97_9ACTN|nr:hypothetical protein LI90_612 [Carbonactinospora thermoautotrophica]